MPGSKITISMPTFGSARTLRKAVTSVLAQTYDDIQLVVVNDAGGQAEWGAIADITDKRLVRFELPVNRGRYYADAVVLRATSTSFYAVHDSDDWSEPQWLEELMAAMKPNVVATFSPQYIHNQGRTNIEPLHEALTTGERLPQMKQLAHHAGLYRVGALRSVGGPNPAYRVGYDTMLVNLIRMHGTIGKSDQPRYHRVIRLGSLTTSRLTGFGSAHRNDVHRSLDDLYAKALQAPRAYLYELAMSMIPATLSVHLRNDAQRLREQL